jgi:1-acyl-sn-glycerol-3-phosphate acyltransferase
MTPDSPAGPPAGGPPLPLPPEPDVLWRSLLHAAVAYPSAVLFAPLALLTFPLPLPSRYAVISQWARFNLWWLERTCRLTFQVEGQEHIPETPTIVMSKHQSAWETLALQGLFRPQVWVLKRELLWVPFFGWGLAMLRPIAIDRGAGRRALDQVARQGAERLAERLWVVVFPEGTRVAPGTRGRYHLGGAVLAERTGYPIVPVAHNAGEFWPRRSLRKRPGTVRLVIGPPVPSAGRKAAEILADVETWIETTVARISTLRPPAA